MEIICHEKRPLVSVIIPCFNAGEYLREAVESALSQTYPEIEVIIVDDGSTNDETIQLLRSHNWPRTRVIFKENGGPASARNAAIRSAMGKYILPLDADDKIDSKYIEMAAAALDANSDIGIVYCRALKFGAQSGPWQLPDYTLRELVIDNVIFVTSLFRKMDWEAVGGFTENLKVGVEDYDFWVKIVSLGRKVEQLDEHLFYYRVGHESRTSGFQRDRAAIVQTYADIFRSNIQFYSKHAEYIFEHRFQLYDELSMYRARYGRLNEFLNAHPKIKRYAASFWRYFLKVLDGKYFK